MTYETPALRGRISDVVAEYDRKKAGIGAAIADFEKAGNELKTAVTIGGTWGNTNINTGSVHERECEESLRQSAWRHVYKGLCIDQIASAADKRRFEQSMAHAPEFNLDSIRATFGDFVADPRGSILRGLAEVFCDLDPAYKSHDKVKIGVQGLPKRIILGNVAGYGSWGKDRLENVLNAVATYQGKPLLTWPEVSALLNDEDALRAQRGVRLRRFANGNGHLFFEPDTLRAINMALAEYYGEVLPDTSEEKPEKHQPGTAVSKDLQYYPTPAKVVAHVLENLYPIKGQRVLEPSCGCGRFMDGLRDAGAKPYGVEVDPVRAAECRTKGHAVLLANFLETVPTGDFDRVVMNPPFYGKHYAKHIGHARKFLKPGGTLTAILPITARYDHGLVDGRWDDLPVGAFSESGTNINTTILTVAA